MNRTPESANAAGTVRPQKIDWLRSFFKTAWIVPSAGLLVGLLLLVFEHPQLSAMGRRFVIALIYATFIGTPSSFLLNWVGFTYAPRFPRMAILLNICVLTSTATVGTAAGVVLMWFTGILRGDTMSSEFISSYPISLVMTLVIGLSITSYETLRHKLHYATLELRTRQMEHERANKLLVEARLSSLESRIHPHFLFNTLNTIAALIPTDPKRAEDTVSKLASLLRFSLNSNHGSLVPLAQELKIVREYLEIESTRFGARLRYRIDVPDAISNYKVPPLALQTLVENAVKHVVARNPAGAELQIAGALEEGRVCLEVIDDGPGFSLAEVAPEHGLGNLSARLELLFGERGQLDVMRRGALTVARIALPAEL
jgi:two-component system, LytTR family, sensor histidine kinase AlgZ